MLRTTRRRWAAVVGGLALVGLAVPALTTPATASARPAPATAGWSALKAGAEPDVNPLKGFIPFEGSYDTFPYSMEWAYFPLDAVMKGPDAFDWSAMDAALDDIASRGHQTALRFYLDYPGRPSGVPQYLLDGGLATHAYDDYGNAGTSVSPDYDDPALRTAIDEFVSTLGARYDGDPRIGFIQAGLLGFWGEWHTYPYNGDAGQPNWMASEATQRDVLDDYLDAFRTTRLMVRNPDGINASLPIGYHDDSFALETKTSPLGWHFMDNMTAAGATGKWQTQPIGGELRPELQSCLFSLAGCPVVEDGGDNDFAGSVAQTHVSWLIDQYAFGTGYTGADKAAALDGARSTGYSFRATAASVPSSVTSGARVHLGLKVADVGIAPFYYDWPITLEYLDASGAVAKRLTTGWHVSDIATGSSATFTGTFDLSGLRSGTYTLVAQVTNPLRNGLPVRFANAAQDADKDGWLTVGTTRVVPSRAGGSHAGHPGGPAHSGRKGRPGAHVHG